jgi:hypothetical protein
MDGLQEWIVGRSRGELDREEDRPDVALKLGGQSIDMVPLKGDFVEAAVRRDMVSHKV